MSLEKFAQSCGVTEISKTIYCYEKWSTPFEIKQAKSFPEYKDFRSSLSKVKDSKKVEEFLKLVNFRLKSKIWKTIQYEFLIKVKLYLIFNFSEISAYYNIKLELLEANVKIENLTLALSPGAEEILIDELHTCPNKFEISKQFFQQNCSTMLDFLKEYNLNGTVTKYFNFILFKLSKIYTQDKKVFLIFCNLLRRL